MGTSDVRFSTPLVTDPCLQHGTPVTRPLLILSIVVAIGSAAVDDVHAFSWVAPPDAFFAEHGDAFSAHLLTVDRFAGADAHVTVHETLAGTSVTTITGTRVACAPGPILSFGVETGRRYVMFLIDTEMAEERSFFPVDANDLVSLDEAWMTWLGFDQPTVSLDAMRTRVEALTS